MYTEEITYPDTVSAVGIFLSFIHIGHVLVFLRELYLSISC